MPHPRERNTLLLAAGYAPRFFETSLDDASTTAVGAALQRLLDAHDPYPGVVLDRYWNVVAANTSAGPLTGSLPPSLAGPPLDVFRACMHPDGLAARMLNFVNGGATWSPRSVGWSCAQRTPISKPYSTR